MREVFPSATIVRPAVLVGVEDRLFNEYARLAKLLPVLLPDGGEGKLQPVFVRDVASAIVESLKDRATLGKDIELAGPAVFTCASANMPNCKCLTSDITGDIRHRSHQSCSPPWGLVSYYWPHRLHM